MTISDRGKALRELLCAIEETDVRCKELTKELLFEFQKNEALKIVFKRITEELK